MMYKTELVIGYEIKPMEDVSDEYYYVTEDKYKKILWWRVLTSLKGLYRTISGMTYRIDTELPERFKLSDGRVYQKAVLYLKIQGVQFCKALYFDTEFEALHFYQEKVETKNLKYV